MMTRMVKFFCSFVIAYCLLPVCAKGQEGSSDASVERRIRYCKLVEQPEKYNHHFFQINAIYRSGGEIMSLYDADCPSRALASWVDYSQDLNLVTSPEVFTEMNRLLKENGRAKITVQLEFYGPKPVTIPRGTSPGLADLMRGTNSRWGHQNQFATRVRFLKILTVEPVPSNVAWPN